MTAADRYQVKLQSIPAPGTGCNPYLLGVADQGVMAGIDPQTIHDDIRQAIPQGDRRVSDAEITRAINRALADHQAGTYTPRPRQDPAVKDGKAALRRIIDQAPFDDEVDIWEASPLRVWDPPKDHAALLLSVLYAPDDLVFIGERYGDGILGDTIRPVSEWIRYFQDGGKTGPHIIVNPLDGIPRPKKDGSGDTLRGDANVREYRYCVVEFDDLGREDQIRFWSAARLPIVALIDSGNKSIHAWLQVSKLARVRTLDEWDEQIKLRLYEKLLIPLGVDPQCKNASRLSRLPGHFRSEKNSMQRLLWLSNEGRSV